MKQKLFALYGVLCVLVFLYACEKEVPYPPQNENKLVVFSYIAPNKDVVVKLSLSKAYFGESYIFNPVQPELNNADVFISDGSISTPLPHIANSTFGVSNTTLIVAGKTYTLKVSHPLYGNISAQTIVPQPIQDPTFDFVALKKDIEANQYYPIDLYSYNFSVSNATSSNMYNRFYPTIEIGSLSKSSDTYNFAMNNPADGVPYLIETSGSANARVERALTLTKQYTPQDYIKLTSSSSIIKHTGHFIACSKDYYLFYKTAQRNISVSPDSPFAQFDNIYSNIVGGYGVFAGYNEIVLVKNTIY